MGLWAPLWLQVEIPGSSEREPTNMSIGDILAVWSNLFRISSIKSWNMLEYGKTTGLDVVYIIEKNANVHSMMYVYGIRFVVSECRMETVGKCHLDWKTSHRRHEASLVQKVKKRDWQIHGVPDFKWQPNDRHNNLDQNHVISWIARKRDLVEESEEQILTRWHFFFETNVDQAWYTTFSEIPSWELTYPFPRHVWRCFSFSRLVGYVIVLWRKFLYIHVTYMYIYIYIYTYFHSWHSWSHDPCIRF